MRRKVALIKENQKEISLISTINEITFTGGL